MRISVASLLQSHLRYNIAIKRTQYTTLWKKLPIG